MRPTELRDALAVLGLSQCQLARDLQMSDRIVRYWLAGTFAIPAKVVALVQASLKRGYYLAPRKR